MKYIFFVLSIILFTSSCRSPEPPQIDILLTYEASDKWISSTTELYTVFFTVRPASGGSININSISNVIHDLENKETEVVFETQHFAEIFHGLKPGIQELLLIDLDGDTTNIEIPYIESIVLEEPFQIVDDEAYTMEFIIDLDSAITEDNGTFSLNLEETEIVISRQ